MLHLRELQQRFGAALFDGDDAVTADIIGDRGIAPRERLAVYRNNLREGFRKTLALEFPVIERLVGEAYFRRLALDFLSAHPSRCGDLHHIGAPFADFLECRFGASEYAYLCDVARLEWAREQALVAADATPLVVTQLRSIAQDDYVALCFSPHPSCSLVHSRYPIVRIWESNQPGAPEQLIDLASGPVCALIHRRRGAVELETLDAASFAWLRALLGGATLGAAVDVALSGRSEFDLSAALSRMICRGIFVAFTVAHPSHASPNRKHP